MMLSIPPPILFSSSEVSAERSICCATAVYVGSYCRHLSGCVMNSDICAFSPSQGLWSSLDAVSVSPRDRIMGTVMLWPVFLCSMSMSISGFVYIIWEECSLRVPHFVIWQISTLPMSKLCVDSVLFPLSANCVDLFLHCQGNVHLLDNLHECFLLTNTSDSPSYQNSCWTTRLCIPFPPKSRVTLLNHQLFSSAH